METLSKLTDTMDNFDFIVKPMNREERRRLSKYTPLELIQMGHFTPEVIEWIKEKRKERLR